MEPTALIADDHPLFRDALNLVVSDAMGADAVIAECASLEDALQLVRAHPSIELSLIDINMPGMDGLAGLARLREAAPTLPVIVVSADERRHTVDSALRAGASGFIPKSLARPDMVAAVHAVLDGDIFVPPGLANRDTGAPPSNEAEMSELARRLGTLTKQERCILDYIVRGKSNKLAAIELDIAESTVKAHVSSILRKLGVHSRTQVAIKAGQLFTL